MKFWPKLYYIVHKCKNVNHHPSSFWKLQFKIKSPVSLVIVKSKWTCFTHMSFKLSRDHFIICHFSGKCIVGIYLSSFLFCSILKLFYSQKSSFLFMGILFCSHLTSLSSKEVTFFNKPLQRNPLYYVIIIPFSAATYKSTHSSVANFWYFKKASSMMPGQKICNF